MRTGADAADIQSALARIQGARVLGTDGEVPYFIRGQLGRASQKQGLLSSSVEVDVREALATVAPVFRLNENDLVLKRATVDAQGHRHLRFQQMKNGLQVVGGELVLHVDAANNVYAANGSARDGSKVSAEAKVAPEAALMAAVEGSTARDASASDARLVYLRAEGSPEPRLAYEVRVKGERDGMPADDLVYVDAQRGGLLLVNPRIHSALNRQVYRTTVGMCLPGILMRSEGQDRIRDPHTDTNYDRLGVAYNCYQALFGRDSYDNAGATLVSSVHHGSNYVNAYWDGTQMVFGDGDGVTSIELGKDLDVVVHELTHAVTEYESNLIYSGESGGLNESMSDIFAGVCKSWFRGWSTTADVFMIGEDTWTPGNPYDALRYMHDPARDGVSLDYFPDYFPGVDVHYSSGISNLVFSLLSKGGTHPRGKTSNAVPAIGLEKAGRIFYKANTDFFTASTTFEQAKTYTVQAAEALYGAGSAESAAVTEAWKAVGVPPPPPVVTALTNGVAVKGISGRRLYYSLEVPAGRSSLAFEISGGMDDTDLYVRYGAVPDYSTYDCRPSSDGNMGTCTFTNPRAGTWYVMLNANSSVTLKGFYTSAPVTETASGSVARLENVSFGPYSVLAGTPFTVTMTGTGNPDLYARFGSAPTTSMFDCRPNASDASETCSLTVPSGRSTAYVMVHGASAGMYNLTISYTQP
ncbi:M4 family metallopeptidase [Archangium violaceum]|uniref:M4 family metallopeptidase n=1 Tax=Archangium violaceum TaxID=83451 RepID=UPI001EEFD9AA|nr:M4 family metallopeptidase [Archangium violaceum]